MIVARAAPVRGRTGGLLSDPMSPRLVDLVLKLGPLHNRNARYVLTVLAHRADADGDCGEVALGELVRATQSTVKIVSEALHHLETDLRLIRRTEQGVNRPGLIRVDPEQLALPTAHQPVEHGTLKVIGGPLQGSYLAAPDLAEVEKIHSHRSFTPNRPLIYRRSTPGNPATEPVLVTHEHDGRLHVYRLSSRCWLYSGVSIRELLDHGAGHTTLARLRRADLHTVEEVLDLIGSWQRYARGLDEPHEGDAESFARHLTGAAAYTHHEPDLVTPTVAATILSCARRWRAARDQTCDCVPPTA